MSDGEGKTVEGALLHWQRLADVGKRPATVRYHRQMLEVFRRHWPDLTMPAASVTADDVTAFVLRVAHFSAPFFNALVSLLKFLFHDAARNVKRRAVNPKQVTLPDQAEFAALLREIDNAHHGHAGLVVRFLALTGLRIGEASRLTWSAVTERGLLVPGEASKNGRPRLVPYIGDLRSVLDRLRAVGEGSGEGQPKTAQDEPGKRPILPQGSCKKALASASLRAGLAQKLTHHDLRRLFATRAIECGVVQMLSPVALPTADKFRAIVSEERPAAGATPTHLHFN